jgi:hypothetical protein
MANVNQARRGRALAVGQLLPPVNPFLGLLPRQFWSRVKDFFVYSVELLPLNASATGAAGVTISNEADFLIMAGVRRVTSSDNLTDVSFYPAVVTIRDSAGVEIMDKAVHIENLFGTAQLPAIWPYPKLIPAGRTLTTTVQSLDTANNRNVRISYLGFKVFPMEA